MAQGVSQVGDGGDEFLTADTLGDVLGRLDGATLARLTSVSTRFRGAALDEALWENLCNQRWPSTKQRAVTTLVASAGGFRKLYISCFPLVSPRHGREHQEDSASPADFVSIVDVTYKGDPVLSRVVDGIPGAGAPCGPLVDVLDPSRESKHGVAILSNKDDGPVVAIHTKIVPRAQERIWQALRNEMRVSWILIHKKTHRMVNLASWKPLSALRQRPCSDDDFLLRFGSILPSPNSTPVHCNITMRCRTSKLEEVVLHSAETTTLIKVTELGFTLEDLHGVHHLRGQEAANLLSRAMTCDKTLDHSKVSASYHSFVTHQTSNREALIRRENQQQTFTAILFVGAIVFLLMVTCYPSS